MAKIQPKTRKKLAEMARCLAEGKSVRQCLKEVGISADTYARHKELVWEMVKALEEQSGESEKKEESILEQYMQEPPPPPGELGDAVKALQQTMQFFEQVERLKQQMISRLAAGPPPPPVPGLEREKEEKKESKSALTSPLEVLKTAHELLQQAKSYLESFGYLVIPPSERHKWYHEEEVKALLKRKGKEEVQGWSKEQWVTMERIVTTIVDRIVGAFERAVLSTTTGPEEQARQELLKEVQQALEEGEGE